MIYGEVNEDGILRDEHIEKCTHAVFEKINEFVNNNLKTHRFRSDIELDGCGLLYGVNEAVRVGDNFIMLRNGTTICALVIDFEMPDLDALLDAGIDVVWIDCTGTIKDFIDGLNGTGVDAEEVSHSISCSLFGYTPIANKPMINPFNF